MPRGRMIAVAALAVGVALGGAAPQSTPPPAKPPESPRLTLEIRRESCAQLDHTSIVRCIYAFEIGVVEGGYHGDLQVTSLTNAPVVGVSNSEAALTPSMLPTDQICDVMAVSNTAQVQAEMGHLGMNGSPTLYGWFCKTVDPAATPPSNLRITLAPSSPFKFRYVIDVDAGPVAAARFRYCAYLDWDGSGLQAPSESPWACFDFDNEGPSRSAGRGPASVAR